MTQKLPRAALQGSVDPKDALGPTAAADREGTARGPRRGAERAVAVTGSAREAFDRSRARARAAAVVAVSGREELRGGTGEQDALPLLREPATTSRSSSHLSRVTAGVVAAVVVVLLVVAVAVAWRQLPSLPSLTSAVPGAGSQSQGTPSAPAAAPAAPASPAAPAPAPVVSGVRVLDPDEQGRSDRLPALLDGDPATSWTSQAYATASFGNLKPGVALVLDLAGSTTVSSVDLVAAGSGGTVEVRTSPDGSMDGSVVVATGPLGSEGAPATIALDPPVETSHVLLWVTTLPQTSSGFRIDLSGVALS